MSDNLDDKKYEAIDPDSIIDLKINGKFFKDLRGMFMSLLLKDRSKDEIAEAIANITKGVVTNENEHQLFIMLTLMLGIEAQAKAQGYIIEESIPDISKELED
jgi:hypothetical protein